MRSTKAAAESAKRMTAARVRRVERMVLKVVVARGGVRARPNKCEARDALADRRRYSSASAHAAGAQILRRAGPGSALFLFGATRRFEQV